MAEQDSPDQVPQGLPAPPPFYKSFTSENLSELRRHCLDRGLNVESKEDAQIGFEVEEGDVPDHLRTLIPPEIPASGEYKSFGESARLGVVQTPSLEDYEVERLLRPRVRSHAALPTRLVSDFTQLIRTLMLNFLELTNIMSANPTQAFEKIGDLRVLFLNAHQLLNEHRPHQARETLLQMMQARVDGLKKQIEDVKGNHVKVDELLRNIGNISDENSAAFTDPAAQAEQLKRQRYLDRSRRMRNELNRIEIS